MKRQHNEYSPCNQLITVWAYFLSRCSVFPAINSFDFYAYFLFFFQLILRVSWQITSSLDWRMYHLQPQRPPYGTTMCAVSILMLWLTDRLLNWRAHRTCRPADISSCKLNALMEFSASAKSKSTCTVS